MENKTKKIERIFKKVFRVSQYKFAAEKLMKAGFSSQDIWHFQKTSEGKYLPSYQTDNTMSEMRNLEIMKLVKESNR